MKHDAALDEEVPQIRTGKRVGEHLHVAHLLPLPADTPFGNLAGKYIDIVLRLDHVNVLVARVFSSYESAKAQNDGRIREHALLAEELVYWLRKTADELIALIHVLAVRQSTGAYPLVRGTSPSFRATLRSSLASALQPRRRRL